jgi:hypothetical protein
MTTYTDTQLKQALAKMLPETLYFNTGSQRLCWISKQSVCGTYVLETELLYLCWLVEETMTMGSLCVMSNEFDITHERDSSPMDASKWKHHKSWQQRVIALCKVKGIEIV